MAAVAGGSGVCCGQCSGLGGVSRGHDGVLHVHCRAYLGPGGCVGEWPAALVDDGIDGFGARVHVSECVAGLTWLYERVWKATVE